jgi:hypothetical protein
VTLQSDPARVAPELTVPADLADRPDHADLTVVTDDDLGPVPSGHVWRELPLALVLTGAALGLVIVALHHFRWGNLILGGSLLLAAFMRLVLPTRQAGLLAIRSRFTDVLTMLALGGSLMLVTVLTRT